jgi:hypothetical protein
MAKSKPMLFGKPMRHRATGDFVLLVAKLQLRVFPIGYSKRSTLSLGPDKVDGLGGYTQRWTFSLQSASGLSGHLMSEQDYDSAERAAAALELMLSEQVIALMTELRHGARKSPVREKPERKKIRRRA